MRKAGSLQRLFPYIFCRSFWIEALDAIQSVKLCQGVAYVRASQPFGILLAGIGRPHRGVCINSTFVGSNYEDN
jgi:hypothetical protein